MEFEELLQDLNEKEEKIFKFDDLYCQKVVEAEEIRCMHILGQIDENERIYRLKQNEKEQIEFDNERYKNLFFEFKFVDRPPFSRTYVGNNLKYSGVDGGLKGDLQDASIL